MTKHPIVLALTGASGAVYAARLLDVLVSSGYSLHLVASPSAAAVFRTELSLELPQDAATADMPALVAAIRTRLAALAPFSPLPASAAPGTIRWHHYQNLMATIASGSALTAGMVVCPCSGGTVSAIAHAASTNLIHRAADVHLKERRRLVLVPRETPLSTIQLENMRRCAEAGATVLPAMPGWYHGVRSIADLVDFVVARICDQLEVEHSLVRRWGD